MLSSTLAVPQNTLRNPHHTAVATRRRTTQDASFFVPRRPAPPAPKRAAPQVPSPKPKNPSPPPTPRLLPLPTPPLGALGPDAYFSPLPLRAALLGPSADFSSYLPTPFLPAPETAPYDPLQHFLAEKGSVAERLFTLHDYIGATSSAADENAQGPSTDAEAAAEQEQEREQEHDDNVSCSSETSIALSDGTPSIEPARLRLARTGQRAWSRRGSALLRRVTRRARGSDARFCELERCGLGGLWEV